MDKKTPRTHTAILALGSNLGDSIRTIERSVEEINQQVGRVLNCSQIYRTTAMNPPGLTQPDFFNCALSCSTSLEPASILSRTQEIEKVLGLDRKEKIHWGPRIIDIDIITVGNICINTPRLTIPHPEMERRDFVLYPLREIEPCFIHPASSISIDKLIENCEKDTPQFMGEAVKRLEL